MRLALPVPLWNFTPFGSFPNMVILGDGVAVVFSENIEDEPTVARALAGARKAAGDDHGPRTAQPSRPRRSSGRPPPDSYSLFPACSAAIMQVPAPTKETVDPETTQTRWGYAQENVDGVAGRATRRRHGVGGPTRNGVGGRRRGEDDVLRERSSASSRCLVTKMDC